MDFGIAMEVDSSAAQSSIELQYFVDKLSVYIKTNDYGLGIENFTVGLVCIKDQRGYKDWYKERKPRFMNVQNIRMPDGTVLELKKSYSYDIKLNDDEVEAFSTSGKKAIEIFSNRFLASLSNFETSSMKKRDFNLSKFRNDVAEFINN